ncbi:MAG: hypothetical protein J6I49_01360 [Bacteroidales bacterium]|nr:hypothetical protein [Bacteroidales bacterium]
MKPRHIILLAAALWSLMPAAGRAQAVASLSADTILLGDQTTLTVRQARNYPSTDMLSRGGIVALEQHFDTASNTQTTLLTCFEPGDRFLHLGPDDSLLLVVLDVEVDTSAQADIRDIADIERIPYTFWEVFRWVLPALGLLAAALLAWWLYTHRKKIQQVLGTAAPVDTRTPEQRALDTLEELRTRKLWQGGKVKEYHTELTDAVRRFIEESTSIRATDMTSDQTVEAVADGRWGVDLQPLRDIFTTADLVKFAKSEPLPSEHDRSMANAVAFVRQMWQQVKPAEAGPKAEKEAADE